jgi:hypothetical protein
LQHAEQPRGAVVPAGGVYESAKDKAVEIKVNVGVLRE